MGTRAVINNQKQYREYCKKHDFFLDFKEFKFVYYYKYVFEYVYEWDINEVTIHIGGDHNDIYDYSLGENMDGRELYDYLKTK